MKWLTDETEVKSVLKNEKEGAERFQWLLFLTNPEQLRRYFVGENKDFTNRDNLGPHMEDLWDIYCSYRNDPESIDPKPHTIELFQAMKETMERDVTMGIQWPGDSFPHFGHFWKAIKHIDVGFTDGHLQLDRNSLVFYSSAASATSNVTQAGGSV